MDRSSAVPLYVQIRDGIIAAVQQQALAPGTRLPPTRDLARQLGVTRVTVVKAYEALTEAGWAEAHVGRGTFLASDPGPGAAPPSEPPAAAAESTWQTLARLADRPGITNFASGAPAPDFFPVEELRRAINAVFDREGAAALQYDAPEGLLPLRQQIADRVGCAVDDVLVTSGTQQAVDLITRTLLRPGDVVLTEAPTYSGALEAFAASGARVIGVPVDRGGLDLDALEQLLQTAKPRLIYTVPAFMTPYGTALAPERRSALLALAAAHGVPVAEDDAYRELVYDGDPLPPLRALPGGERVLHVGSFSKLMAPGLRLGYVIATAETRQTLVARKQMADLHTSTLIQHAVRQYLASGSHEAHLRQTVAVCRQRRDAAVEALTRLAVPGLTWHVPAGGPFIWLRLPPGQAVVDTYVCALDHGVAFAIGAAFFPDRRDHGWLRLNFTLHEPEQIRQGISRLAAALQDVRPEQSVLPL